MRDTRAELLIQAETLVRGRGYAGFSYADLAAAGASARPASTTISPARWISAAALVAAYAASYARRPGDDPLGLRGRPGRIEAYGPALFGGVEQGLGCLCAALAIEGEALPERLRRDIAALLRGSSRVAGSDPARGPGGWQRSGRDGSGGARPLRHRHPEGALLMERLFASPDAFRGTLAVLVDGLRPR